LMAFSTSAACRDWWRGMCVSDTSGSPRGAESDFVEETDTMRVRPAIPVVVFPVSDVGDVVPVATGPSASILDHYSRSQGSAALGDQEITRARMHRDPQRPQVPRRALAPALATGMHALPPLRMARASEACEVSQCNPVLWLWDSHGVARTPPKSANGLTRGGALPPLRVVPPLHPSGAALMDSLRRSLDG